MQDAVDDAHCLNTMNITRGLPEVLGDTPEDATAFKQRYRQDSDYQGHIEKVWGARKYDTRPQVDIDKLTEFGIDNGWGGKCAGNMIRTGNSRHNAADAGVLCCSKFRNGQVAFNLPGPKNGINEDCGYGWSGRMEDWDADELQLIRVRAPPAWMDAFLRLEDKPLLSCEENLLSGSDFAKMAVSEQLLHLLEIQRCICFSDAAPFGQGEHVPEHLERICTTCNQQILNFIDNVNSYAPPIQIDECRTIITEIFTLYSQLHNIASRMQGISAKKGLRKFTKDFLRLCNNLVQEGGLKRKRKSKTKNLRKYKYNKTKRKKRNDKLKKKENKKAMNKYHPSSTSSSRAGKKWENKHSHKRKQKISRKRKQKKYLD